MRLPHGLPYIVQAFNAGKGGHLKPDSPIVCNTESATLRTAERLALSKLAVVAFSSSGDLSQSADRQGDAVPEAKTRPA
ncbi:hypothetical protein [Bradyrhizobium genosp. P]|uniref:hypothetical protein n=1 Tax=Bradyrhizobium genosp. P TaxID=83641 RepID=UPI003CF2554B